MTKTLSLLLASAALTAVVGLPAWSAMHTPSEGGVANTVSTALAQGSEKLLHLVDSDEDDDEGGSSLRRGSSENEDSDECEDDDGACGAASPAPAPVGSVPPPQNGLFGTGTPQVKVK